MESSHWDVVHSPVDIARYHQLGQWSDASLSDHVSRARAARPHAPAFFTDSSRVSWAHYDDTASRLAGALVAAGLRRRQHLGVFLPDGPSVHIAYLAAERAGLVVVGISPRAGAQEIAYLLRAADAEALLTHDSIRGRSAQELGHELAAHGLGAVPWIVVPDLAQSGLEALELDGTSVSLPSAQDAHPLIAGRGLHPDDLFLLNSTSGTTGLPKVVMHNENHLLCFSQLAIEAGLLTGADVFLSAVPSPYAFGLWSAHFAPAMLGATTGLVERSDAAVLLELVERERVSVMACVTTQMIMLAQAPAVRERDLRSLRLVFTGGEPVPFARAAEFEELTGASVLQFYGSNEAGALSRTTVEDSHERRLRTCGRTVATMNVRLYDAGRPIDAHRGQAACRGPSAASGYYRDPQANGELLSDDGWVLTGDIVEIDDEGYLRVVGRASDIIIRGGKNISATAVEDEVSTHPSVARAAAVAMPDAVFGERVCVYVELRPAATLELEELTAHLADRGVSKEWFPERLVVLGELPQSAGGKVAKQELRADIRRRLAAEEED